MITSTDCVPLCTTHRTALDPSIRNSVFDIPNLTIEMYLKFSISNGKFLLIHEILSEFPECNVDCHVIDNSHSSDTD